VPARLFDLELIDELVQTVGIDAWLQAERLRLDPESRRFGRRAH
jgi:hypothetical protein